MAQQQFLIEIIIAGSPYQLNGWPIDGTNFKVDVGYEGNYGTPTSIIDFNLQIDKDNLNVYDKLLGMYQSGKKCQDIYSLMLI